MTEQHEERGLSFGETVYDEDGQALGTVRGFDENGFYVTMADGVEALSSEHVTAGQPGEGELMWRCLNCGEMGKIDDGGLPEECPNCGVPKEEIYYWTED